MGIKMDSKQKDNQEYVKAVYRWDKKSSLTFNLTRGGQLSQTLYDLLVFIEGKKQSAVKTLWKINFPSRKSAAS